MTDKTVSVLRQRPDLALVPVTVPVTVPVPVPVPAPAPVPLPLPVSLRDSVSALDDKQNRTRDRQLKVYVGSKQSDLTLTVEYEHAHKTLL